jgi:hypothetical protein
MEKITSNLKNLYSRTNKYIYKVWAPPFFIAIILVIIYNSVLCKNIITDNYTIEKFVNITTDLIGFIGVLTTILIAVLTWTYSLSRNNSDTGFATLRNSINQMETLSENMAQDITRANTQNQKMLLDWVFKTNDITDELNEITPVWEGWEKNQSLENDLVTYTDIYKSFDPSLINFLISDQKWSIYRVKQGQGIRNIFIGLFSMDRGVVLKQLFDRIIEIFFSLIILLMILLILRLFEDIPINFIWGNLVNATLAATISLLSVAHLIWLAWAIWQWKKEVSKRDKIMKS